MGTKRPFDEDLEEFIKHPKHLDYGNDIASEGGRKYFHTVNGPESENDITVPHIVFKEFELNAPLPLVTGISTDDDDSEPGPMFPPYVFSSSFENNLPRRPLFRFQDIYSSLLNSPPRKEIPIGPNHQADVPEFDAELASKYRENSGMLRFLGVCVVPIGHSIFDSDIQAGCECFDGGSIRCVQQHVNEARLKLKKFYGDEKFAALGMLKMGEEVSSNWTEEEERLFHEVVYLNPATVGGRFWKELAIEFPSRTKKEIVSYYFNVFILRRRAVQNRSQVLYPDSDNDEWRESYGGAFGDQVEDDFMLGDGDGSSVDDDNDGDGGEDNFVLGIEDSLISCKEVDAKSSLDTNEIKVTSGCEEEK